MIRKFFSPPAFESDEDNFRAKFINGFAWVVSGLLVLGMIPYLLEPGGNLTIAILSGLIVVLLSSLVLLRRGYVNASAWVVVLLGWLGIGFQAFTADGVKDAIVLAYIAIGLLASIVISHRTGSLVILASIAVIALLAVREANGFFQPREQDPVIYGRDLGFIFLTIAVLIYFSTTSLKDAIVRATKSEQNLRASNDSLRDLNQTLEQRVAARTAELEQANQHNARRARQFEAIAQVTKVAAANRSLEELISLLAQVVSEKFEYYHTGIFLLDGSREYAELRAASSEGGKRLLSRSHKLRIGQTGIVGYVAATGEPRIALDVGTDAAFFSNPDLPDTHSEMALPLKTSGLVIGALDIQSTERNAFTEEDIEILSSLADQVATAIQNAQYYEATQRLVEEAQRMTGSYLHDAWRTLKSQEQFPGYVADGNTLKPSRQPIDASFASKVANLSQPAVENGEKPSLAVPISVAGSVVGIMNVNLGEDHEWETDEMDIAKAVAERLSLALEAATLLETTQKRAEIERLTADITGRIGSTTQFDSILRTAAEELSRALNGSEVLIQIQTKPAEKSANTPSADRTTPGLPVKLA
jgi:GAF domain-containing protein